MEMEGVRVYLFWFRGKSEEMKQKRESQSHPQTSTKEASKFLFSLIVIIQKTKSSISVILQLHDQKNII